MKADQAHALHDLLLESQPEGARHDSDICPFCVEQASQGDSQSGNPPAGDGGPDVSGTTSQENTKGGTTDTMGDNANMISNETHEALKKAAVEQATAATDQALATVTSERDTFKANAEKAEQELAAAKADNERLNKELDEAQIAKKAAEDKVAELEKARDEAEAEKAKAELASKRSEQVKGLGLFDDKVITERASAWAALTDEAWAERLGEWQELKPSKDGKQAPPSETAMSGSSTTAITDDTSDQAAETAVPARRLALGLGAKKA